MKYLRLFETESQYETTKGDFKYPTVSYTKDASTVHYMTLREKYTREYFTFEALESGTFTLTIPADVNSTYMTSVSYSTDNGETWTTTTVDNTAQTITTPSVNTGSKVLWKGVGKQMAKSSYTCSYFSSTGNFNLSGNIMSLLYGDEFQDKITFSSGSEYNFTYLFKNLAKLVNAKNLILPATTLASYCYRYMFSRCSNLTTAPELPATTLASNCYDNMFDGCTSLATAPELPATTLASYCYQYMFSRCSNLTTAPELPATTLESNCYNGMFSRCSNLTTAPELPATTLAISCYNDMFYLCKSLTTAPVLPTTRLANSCYSGMFAGCKSLTTAPVLPATTLKNHCYSEMFRDCTSLATAPELPATTLAAYCYNQMFDGTNVLPDCTNIDFTSQTVVASGGLRGLFEGTKVTYSDLNNILPINGDNKPCLPVTTLAESCYANMFYGCTSLTTAPDLPATTLTKSCYNQMFSWCTKLNYIKAMFTTTPSSSYTNNWVSGVAATGTFVKNSAATWDETGVNGVPTGWTVETAAS